MIKLVATFKGILFFVGVPKQVERIVHCALDIFEVPFFLAITIFGPHGIIIAHFVPRGDDNHKDPMVNYAYEGQRLYYTCVYA